MCIKTVQTELYCITRAISISPAPVIRSMYELTFTFRLADLVRYEVRSKQRSDHPLVIQCLVTERLVTERSHYKFSRITKRSTCTIHMYETIMWMPWNIHATFFFMTRLFYWLQEKYTFQLCHWPIKWYLSFKHTCNIFQWPDYLIDTRKSTRSSTAIDLLKSKWSHQFSVCIYKVTWAAVWLWCKWNNKKQTNLYYTHTLSHF